MGPLTKFEIAVMKLHKAEVAAQKAQAARDRAERRWHEAMDHETTHAAAAPSVNHPLGE